MTGSSGNAIAQNCYGVFGQVMTTNPSSGNPLQYLGGMAEPSTGLDAIDSGFYEPDLGRLLSGNPAGAAGPSLGAGLSVFARTAPGAAGGVPSGSRDLLNRAGDFFGCWGDIITFGGTSRLRQIIGGAFFGVNGDLVDHSSDACAAGHAVGIAHGVATVLVGVLPPTTAVAGSATAGTAAASASSGPCFPAGTTITTRRGARSIEKVRAGDVVLSADPHTGRRSFQQVVRTFEHRVSLLMKIETADGRSVEATPTHPFWVEGKGFVAAKRLARGDLLEDEQSQGVAVAKVTARRGRFTVYNFEVAHTHTYFAAGFWVHNTCVPPPPSIEDVGFTVDQIENHILPRHGFQRAAEGAGEFSEDYSDWWTLGPLIDEALSMAPSNDTWTWNVDDQSYNFSVALGKPIGQTGGRVTSSTLGLAVQANGFGLTAYPE